MPNFRICDNKGFHITFPNGYTISVQIGAGNYCDNYNVNFAVQRESRSMESDTAETAYWGPDNELISEVDGDCVQGYQTVEQVWERMQRVAALPYPRKDAK